MQGDICNTIDEYFDRNPHVRISMLHIDTDVYEPSKKGLDKLWDKIVRGGGNSF